MYTNVLTGSVCSLNDPVELLSIQMSLILQIIKRAGKIFILTNPLQMTEELEIL